MDIEASDILIEDIQVYASDASIPYRLQLFACSPPADVYDWDEEDLIQMETVNQRVFTFAPAKALPYTDHDGLKRLHGAIEIGNRPIQIDLLEGDPKDIAAYYRAPVTYTVTLRYRLKS